MHLEVYEKYFPSVKEQFQLPYHNETIVTNEWRDPLLCWLLTNLKS
jgi:hypothetical protein